MSIQTKKIKPYVLPTAIILGLIFHNFCEQLSALIPYLIFSILILTFSTTRLRSLKFEKLDLWLMLCQTGASLLLYPVFRLLLGDVTIAQGIMMGALCPVASSVTVVAMMLGAKRENTIAYTIVGNLLICVLAPAIFVFIGNSQPSDITDSFFSILGRISTVIGLPFFIMLVIQLWAKPVSDAISRYSSCSFYLWAMALFLTLGQTIDFIYLHGQGHWIAIIILGVGSGVMCPLQFLIGRMIGRKCGDAVAGQQLLGQKNSAMGIWMANTYLSPLASSFLAFYSIWQNLLNSWQIYSHEKSANK
ncbi:MAG: hypothetical protein NC402_03100 [Prevotella sp.]|nr:hypothetical protein [Prevotella sp.]MCM1075106.1 hypothetical protein [Ruminococcus sp.]